MTAVLASAFVGQPVSAYVGQAKRVIKLAIGQQSAVGGDHTAAKLQQYTAVKIEPQHTPIRFTRRVRHRSLGPSCTRCCNLCHNHDQFTAKCGIIRGIRVYSLEPVYSTAFKPVVA
jgi:hypothetical protein